MLLQKSICKWHVIQVLKHIFFYWICLSKTMYKKNIHLKQKNKWQKYITSIHKTYSTAQSTPHQSSRQESWQELNFCDVPTFSHTSRQVWVGNAATSLWFTWASPRGRLESARRNSGEVGIMAGKTLLLLCSQPALLFWQNTCRKLLKSC